MKTHETVLGFIENFPVIPVYYEGDPEICLEVLSACYAGGIRVFEFTNRGPAAVENFKILMNQRDSQFPEMKLGIGTIKTSAQASVYIDLGADFIVSPIVSTKLAEVTSKGNVFWIPGCMTPTEIALAEELGATLIKLFPGDTLGPGFLKGIKPLFPDLKFMPTGGVEVNKENVDSWLNAGVTALGFGSKLFQRPVGSNDYHWLTERCRVLLKLVNKG